MIWLVLALASAVLTAVLSLLEKKTLNNEHSLQLSSFSAVLNLVLSLPLLVFVDFGSLDNSLVLFVYFVSWFSLFGHWMILKSMRHEELSSVIPLANVSPLLLLFLAAVFLGESLSFTQLGGALLMVGGVYLLEAAVYGSPLKLLDVAKAKYTWIMLAGVVLFSFTALADKIALNSLTAVSYIILIQLFLAVNYLLLFTAIAGRNFRDAAAAFRRDWKALGTISALTVVNRLAFASAVAATYVSLVIPVKRLSTLFATVAGGSLFNEKNVAAKAAACGLMIAGVYFVVAQ
ncbi:MAG: EamA family transporter [Candidatus Micrarchaeota archaeon]